MAKRHKWANEKELPLEVEWEYIEVEDAEERLLKALKIILGSKKNGG